MKSETDIGVLFGQMITVPTDIWNDVIKLSRKERIAKYGEYVNRTANVLRDRSWINKPLGKDSFDTSCENIFRGTANISDIKNNLPLLINLQPFNPMLFSQEVYACIEKMGKPYGVQELKAIEIKLLGEDE